MELQEPIVELEREIRQLRQTMNLVRLSLVDLKAGVVDLLAPRQRPRPEVLVALQLLATRAGLPTECSNHECRRTGVCQAEDVGEPLCEAFWPEQLSQQFDDMAAGIELSAWCTERREAELYAQLTRLVEVPAASPPRRSRKRHDVARRDTPPGSRR